MLLRLTELRVPSWSAKTPSMPLRDPPVEAGQDMARRPPSSQKIGRLLQHPPSPLSTRSRNRVRYKAWCVCVLVRRVCGEVRGAWGAGGVPVSSGLVRLLGLRVCLASRLCCLPPAAPVSVVSESAVASLCPVRVFLYPAVSVRLCACVRGCVVCSSASQRFGACGLRPESEIVCCAVYLMMIAWSCANSSLLCS